MTNDLLFEIGTEELPARGLQELAQALGANFIAELDKAAIAHGDYQVFATPRRLAVLINQVAATQADRMIERRGPALTAAFTADGKATPAAEGFARSCGIAVQELEQQETPQGVWLVFRQHQTGQPLAAILPELLERTITQLPMTKPMRWGDSDTKFSRPIHWLVLLHGKELIPATLFNIATGHETYGHRFHHPAAIHINTASDYAQVLQIKGKVLANFAERCASIAKQAAQLAATVSGKVFIQDELLEEVTGLVEWPVALLANFEQRFLTVPHEALMTSMQYHQKCFPVVNQQGELLPHFIAISNIESADPQQVIIGNERVVRARLSDAAFFYETDCKQRLDSRLDQLKQLVFQTKLGSVYDKTQRIAELAQHIYSQLASLNSANLVARAAYLSKADLVTALVGEFPELQGIAGFYYAKHDAEDEQVALAIREHYLPRFANDELPQSAMGCALALADRLDTIVGLFAINQPPSGNKDPFGLRRAAIAILRILIDQQANLSLQDMLEFAIRQYPAGLLTVSAAELIEKCSTFISERLYAIYPENSCAPDTLTAVLAVDADKPFDIDQRARGLQQFRAHSAIAELIANNKRIRNLLLQAERLNLYYATQLFEQIDPAQFIEPSERELYRHVSAINHDLQTMPLPFDSQAYQDLLTKLLGLGEPLHNLFEQVMIMAPEPELANNRLQLLAATRNLFLRVADISLLQ